MFVYIIERLWKRTVFMRERVMNRFNSTPTQITFLIFEILICYKVLQLLNNRSRNFKNNIEYRAKLRSSNVFLHQFQNTSIYFTKTYSFIALRISNGVTSKIKIAKHILFCVKVRRLVI